MINKHLKILKLIFKNQCRRKTEKVRSPWHHETTMQLGLRLSKQFIYQRLRKSHGQLWLSTWYHQRVHATLLSSWLSQPQLEGSTYCHNCHNGPLLQLDPNHRFRRTLTYFIATTLTYALLIALYSCFYLYFSEKNLLLAMLFNKNDETSAVNRGPLRRT